MTQDPFFIKDIVYKSFQNCLTLLAPALNGHINYFPNFLGILLNCVITGTHSIGSAGKGVRCLGSSESLKQLIWSSYGIPVFRGKWAYKIHPAFLIEYAKPMQTL